jgi:nucleoside-diphosphate-sugar epimerase
MTAHIVIGGTGFVGRHLIRALALRGDSVIVIARHEQEDTSPHVVFEKGDARHPFCGLSPERVTELKALRPVVWNLAANLSFRDEESDAVASDNVLIATHGTALANEVGERYVFMSTAYVSGQPKGTIIPEDVIAGPVHRNAYEASKWKGEGIVRSLVKVPFVILRPSIIIGDADPKHAVGCTFGYYRYSYMFFVFKDYLTTQCLSSKFHPLVMLFGVQRGASSERITAPRLAVPFPRGSRVDMVPIGYVVDVMIALLSHDDAFDRGVTINCTHSHPPLYADLASYLCDDLGIDGARFIPVPHALFRFGFSLLRRLVPGRAKEFDSAEKYLPYITEQYNFDRQNSVRYALPEPPPLTREFLHGVNTHAITAVFSRFRS